MRCHQARIRIAGSRADQMSTVEDKSLLDHLRECQSCADHATASGWLNRLIQTASEGDDQYLTPLDIMRQKVENRLSAESVSRSRADSGSLNWAIRLLPTRPVSRWTTVVVAVVLAVVALVPITSYRTVGYDLNLDGINRDLAQNDERICDLLEGLGLFEAGVDVISCDTTCSLSILDLKTEREAVLVVSAIARLNSKAVTTNIVPIRTRTSRSLIDQAHELIRGDRS